MTQTELKEYLDRINSLIDSPKTGYLRNTDREHNVVVMCKLLDSSNSVCMFSGMGSVFSHNFLDDNGLMFNPYDSSYDSTANVGKAEISELMRKSVFDFLSRSDKSLSIIVQNKREGIKRLKEGYIGGYLKEMGTPKAKLNIYALNDEKWFDNGIKHFSFSSDGPMIARLETNPDSHSAICSFHTNTDFAQNLTDAFNYLLSNSTAITI